MCGRFTYLFTWPELHRLMSLTMEPAGDLPPRYNVAPTQLAPVVRRTGEGERTGAMLRWGLVPFWSKGPGTLKSDLINARAETVATSPAFKHAFKGRRALVPVSGFYEWKATPGSKTKQPYLIRPADGGVFTLAGLWERWTPPEDGEPLETFTIITTTPNETMAPIHNRMPVIVGESDWDRWLDPGAGAGEVGHLLAPAPADGMEAVRISTRVNSPRNDDPSVLEPVDR